MVCQYHNRLSSWTEAQNVRSAFRDKGNAVCSNPRHISSDSQSPPFLSLFLRLLRNPIWQSRHREVAGSEQVQPQEHGHEPRATNCIKSQVSIPATLVTFQEINSYEHTPGNTNRHHREYHHRQIFWTMLSSAGPTVWLDLKKYGSSG